MPDSAPSSTNSLLIVKIFFPVHPSDSLLPSTYFGTLLLPSQQCQSQKTRSLRVSVKTDSWAMFFTTRKILITSVQHMHLETTVTTALSNNLTDYYHDFLNNPLLMPIALPRVTYHPSLYHPARNHQTSLESCHHVGGCQFPFLSGSHTPTNIYPAAMLNTNLCVLCINPSTNSTSPLWTTLSFVLALTPMVVPSLIHQMPSKTVFFYEMTASSEHTIESLTNTIPHKVMYLSTIDPKPSTTFTPFNMSNFFTAF